MVTRSTSSTYSGLATTCHARSAFSTRTSSTSTVEDLEPYDQVIFLAGLSNDPMAEFSPSKNFIFNAAAPAYLAYTAKNAKVKRYIYASSCSVYGYTENELYDETRPVSSNYPYGISKLQGEQAAVQLADDDFSVIALRKGTVSGYSPRMRFDLIINTMFRNAVREHVITVNNPSIWRPILGIEDAATAYIRAVEANYKLSGIFNVASGNYTVGEVGDLIKSAVEDRLNIHVNLNIKHIQDFRNYKVSMRQGKQCAELPSHRRCEVHCRISGRQHGQVPGLGQSALFQHPGLQETGERDRHAFDGGGEGSMKIAVIGANGQLGNDVVAAFTKNGDEVVPLTHAEIELSNIDSVSSLPAGSASASRR